MIFQAKRGSSSCFILFAALLGAALPAAHAQIPMRGFNGDLRDTHDTFLSLDLNGDGKADMLYSRPGSGTAGAYLSHGDGTFHYIPYVGGGTPQNGFIGDLGDTHDTFLPLDLNGDGKSDFIEYRPGSGDTIRCLSNGDGTVKCDRLSSGGTDYFNFADKMTNGNEKIVTLDMNHDGLADFIVYTPGGGSARLYLAQANSSNLTEIALTENGAAKVQTGFAEDMQPNNVRIVPIDYNGDGYTDLLVYTPQYGEVRLYENTGRNTFSLQNLSYGGRNNYGFTGNSTDPNPHLIALDLNGDGKQDFLWWQAGSRTVIGYLSNGNGTFAPINYQANGSTANGFQDNDNSTADTAVALDADGDGKQDFLWYSPGSNNVATLYLSGSGGALNGAVFYGGQLSASTNNGVVLPLNFLGQRASGFVSYVPGSGANNATPLFNAYTLSVTDRQSSILGKLNTYNFYAYPGSFLSDLSWSIGDVPLKEIVMPGTHDSAMYNMIFGEGDLSETQWGDVPYQLSSGARYFDFRTGYFVNVGGIPYDPDGRPFSVGTLNEIYNDSFLMYGHSTVATDYRPQDLINQIEDWLYNNPNEVVVLDMSALLAGSQRDNVAGFASMLNGTHYPQMIYTQQIACKSNSCQDPRVQPQNVSINQLHNAGTLPNGARLILVRGPQELTNLGWEWQNAVATQVGYCNDSNGRSSPSAELNCINNPDISVSGSQSMEQARPSYEAADAAAQFMHFQAQLTPGGYNGFIPNLDSPLHLADGYGGANAGFNNGTDGSDLNVQLAEGAWNTNALNMVTFDGIGHDDIAKLFIQRNRQTWVNKNFFNNNAANPAGALSIGANGDIWAAGAGHSISIFKYVNGAWKALINSQPNVKKLAVDPQGGVWVVDGSQGTSSTVGDLWHYDQNGQSGTNYNKLVQDVSVGADGSVWLIENGQLVAYIPPSGTLNTLRVPSQQGTRVAVDNRGYPWVIQSTGYIYRYDGSNWVQVSQAQGKEIVAAADGSIFITGYSTPSIGRYNVQNNNFDFLQMDARHIAVEPGGQPWAIRQGSGIVYKGSLDQM